MFSAHTAENKGCIFLQLSCNYVWLWLSSGEWDINWIVWQLLETSHKRKLTYAFCPVLLSASLLLGSLVIYSQIENTISQPWHHSHSGLGWFFGMCCSVSRCQWHPSPFPDSALWQSDMSPHCLLSSGVGWMPLRTADLEQPTWDQEWQSHWFPWE